VIACLLPDGSLDPQYGTNGLLSIPETSIIKSAIALPDGKALFYASQEVSNDIYQTILLQYLPNGLPDSTFGNAGIFVSPYPNIGGNRMIKIDDHRYLATASGGIIQQFITDLNVGTLDIRNENPQNVLIYPNPIANQFTLSFQLGVAENITIELSNISGQHEKTLLNKQLFGAGKHETNLHLGADLPAGNYVLTLSVQGKAVSSVMVSKM
jgi:Secretion system C-terminal sorting domain